MQNIGVKMLLIILAVVQIIVESLPISSSGHVALVSKIAAVWGYPLSALSHNGDAFLHIYTAVMVLIFFRKLWWPILRRLLLICGAIKAGKPLRASQKNLLVLIGKQVVMLAATCGLTAVGYFLIKGGSATSVWYTAPQTMLAGFIVTATLLILGSVRWPHLPIKKTTHQLVLLTLGITAAQVCAVLPGISRFASTTVIGIILGLSPRRAVQWSWVIFMPLMAAAALVHGIGGMLLREHNYQALQPAVLAACIAASIISYWGLGLVQRLFLQRQVWLLGLYMLLPIMGVWFLLL